MRIELRAACAAVLAGALALQVPPTSAQPAVEPASAAKKELVARVLKAQQAGIENLARQLAEQPALQLAGPVRLAISRLPKERREAVAREIEGDVQRYAQEVVPIVRDRAVALAPVTIGPLLEQRFTEEELRTLVAFLESPVNARYQALGIEMQRALGMKVVSETRPAVDPKVKALEQSIQNRLRAAMAAASGAASGPRAGPGPGLRPGPAAGPGLSPRAPAGAGSGPGN